MVHGLDKIQEYLGDYPEQYCIIGGTACDIIMSEIGVPFRATRDMDIVLITELVTKDFCRSLWNLIDAGGYTGRINDKDKNNLYRFINPKNVLFPTMIELFSRKPENFEIFEDSKLTPIHIGEDVLSLSAILLDTDYYNLFADGKKILDGISVLSEEYLLLLKIRAYIDFRQRSLEGENGISSKVTKHKNDIFRLLFVLSPSLRVDIKDTINKDIKIFLDLIKDDTVNLKNFGIKTVTLDQLLERLQQVYDIY